MAVHVKLGSVYFSVYNKIQNKLLLSLKTDPSFENLKIDFKQKVIKQPIVSSQTIEMASNR